MVIITTEYRMDAILCQHVTVCNTKLLTSGHLTIDCYKFHPTDLITKALTTVNITSLFRTEVVL